MKGVKEILLRTGFLICLGLLILIVLLPAEDAAVASSVYGSVYEMPVPLAAGNCTRCHEPADHPMSNCSKCHDEGKKTPAATLSGGHGGLNVSDSAKLVSTAPVGNCLTCHKYRTDGMYFYDTCSNCHPEKFGYTAALTPNPSPRFLLDHTHDSTRLNVYNSQVTPNFTFNCEMCHLQQASYGQKWWPAIPERDLTTFGSASRHQSALAASCGNCHTGALTTEHSGRTASSTGQLMDCYSCHSSTSPAVKTAIKTGNTNCASCHSRAHTQSLSSNIPADISLYSGFQWTHPLPLSTWTGEAWVPAEFLPNGHILISDRRTDVTGDQIWNFYKTDLTAKGWISVDPEPAAGSNNFRIKFTKGTVSILIWYYGGIYHTNEPVLPQGSRIEIIY